VKTDGKDNRLKGVMKMTKKPECPNCGYKLRALQGYDRNGQRRTLGWVCAYCLDEVRIERLEGKVEALGAEVKDLKRRNGELVAYILSNGLEIPKHKN